MEAFCEEDQVSQCTPSSKRRSINQKPQNLTVGLWNRDEQTCYPETQPEAVLRAQLTLMPMMTNSVCFALVSKNMT